MKMNLRITILGAGPELIYFLIYEELTGSIIKSKEP